MFRYIVAPGMVFMMAFCGVDITDDANKTFRFETYANKIFAASPSLLYTLYALSPELPNALNMPLTKEQSRWLEPCFASLPVAGGWFGQGKTPNLEALLMEKPDVAIAWLGMHKYNDMVEKTFQKMHIPLIYIDNATLEQLPQNLQLLGKLSGLEYRASVLAKDASLTLTRAEEIRSQTFKRKSVYLAQDADALSTECPRSFHARVLEAASANMSIQCKSMTSYGKQRVSFEQVVIADPDVIIAMEKDTYSHIRKDPKWQQLRALKNNALYLVPQEPFNWYGRPPTFLQLLGVEWTLSTLYPRNYPYDFQERVRDFFKLWMNIELTPEQQKLSRAVQ